MKRFRVHPTRQPIAQWSLSLALSCALLALSCGRPNVLVPKGPHLPARETAPIRVRTAPPPARVEVIPLRRNRECFYRDGYWSPKGATWTWTKGDWVLVPESCYYAPPQTRYEVLEIGTTLVHRPGAWHPVVLEGEIQCPPVQACPDANASQ